MNYDEELLDRIDAYAKRMNVNRTAAISFIVNQYFQSVDTVNTLDRALKIIDEKEKTV